MTKKRYINPISCVYKITFEKYIYIGSTSIFSKRKFEHLWMLKKNIHPNPILQNVFNKHGADVIKFTIIEELPIDELIKIEQKYIDFYKEQSDLRLINILLIAGSSLGYKPSEESNEKRRASMTGKVLNKRSEEYCQQQSIKQKGREITPEWRKNISKSLKGRPSPNKPKRFIEYNDNVYTFKEFSMLVGCDLSTLYTTKKDFTERKYNCKFNTKSLVDSKISIIFTS